jgi:hypothetical protein
MVRDMAKNKIDVIDELYSLYNLVKERVRKLKEWEKSQESTAHIPILSPETKDYLKLQLEILDRIIDMSSDEIDIDELKEMVFGLDEEEAEELK